VTPHVDIREVALRDGLQIETPIPLSAKLELLDAVAATGVREVEATAFVSPTKVPSMADAAELAAELHNYPDIEFSALVASPNGAKRAVAARLRSIEYVVAASDAFSMANVGRPVAEATDQIGEVVQPGYAIGSAGAAHNTRSPLQRAAPQFTAPERRLRGPAAVDVQDLSGDVRGTLQVQDAVHDVTDLAHAPEWGHFPASASGV